MMRKGKYMVVLLAISILFLQLCPGVKLSGDHGNAAVNAAPVVLRGNITVSELVVDGGKSVVVSGSTIILTGNITVKDQGELLITESRIQLSIRGEKAYNISIRNLGKMIVVGSTLETLSGVSVIRLSEEGSMILTNSNVIGFSGIRSSGNSTMTVQDSQLNVGSVVHAGKTISIVGGSMPQGLLNITNWRARAELEGFTGDRIVMLVDSSRLMALECNQLVVNSSKPIQLNNSKVASCVLWSGDKTSVTDSTFGNLVFYSSGIATNVNVTAKGVLARAGGPIYAASMNATVLRYWYLNVKVTDLPGTGVPARIVVTDYLNQTAATGQADADGKFRKPFLAEIINITRTIFVGNYRVKADYLNYTTPTSPVVLDGDKDVWVKFTQSVPVVSTTKLTVSATKIYVGDTVSVEGSINTKKPGEYVQVTAVGPGDIRNEQALKTDQNGVFKGKIKLQVEGEWYIYADWLGGASEGMSTKSQAFIITVQPRPSIVFLLVRAMPIIIVVLGVIFGLAFLALGRRKKVKK